MRWWYTKRVDPDWINTEIGLEACIDNRKGMITIGCRCLDRVHKRVVD